MPVSRPPWVDLPADLPSLMRPHLREVTDAVITALPQEVPSYARPLEGAFGEGVHQGVAVALGRFLDLPGTELNALSVSDRNVYVALGRGELRQGRELETLLAAYRVGARVAFRQFAALTRETFVDVDVLILLAESVFAYIEELSSASAEGYAHEQSLRAGESGRRRTLLLTMLLDGIVDEPATVEAAARARYALPQSVVVITVPPAYADGLALALGDSALVGEQGEWVVAIAPAPASAAERSRLDRRLADRLATVGPPRHWSAAPASLRQASLAASCLPVGRTPLHVEEHLAAMVLLGAPELADELANRRLAPLKQVKADTADRLAETLLSWLRHRGERQHIASELHVHTQTVGYRLGQLRSLFGEALKDPDARFELELSLRYRASTPRTSNLA